MARRGILALAGVVAVVALLGASGVAASASAPAPPRAAPAVTPSNSTLVNVTFQALHLPSGSVWTVTAGSPPVSQNNTTVGAKGRLVFSEPNGSVLNYTITGPALYGVAKVVGKGIPSQTSDMINGTTMITVSFAPIVTLTFNETGLASGTVWGITITSALPHGGSGSQDKTSNSSSLSFTVVKGTWKFNVSTMPASYAARPSHGAVGAGHAAAKDLRFKQITGKVVFNETGLAAHTLWQVNITGPVNVNKNSTSPVIRFVLPEGTYTFTAENFTSQHPTPTTGTFTVTGPGSQDEAIAYS